ncbi:hypothetical protein DSD26_16510 [Bacillus velezensis]|nr:hypothetical protein A1R12_05850 [Bacillus amyloliquefaciens]KMO08006.1 hypothetical protein TH57_08340 [Bacillus amyloliquefaciens]PAC76395.1 hypothetical protein CHI11_19760 [Bacillus velezensis]RBY98881.1 hypothetical protein DSD26_16510 [Bacillus velezensis]
MNLYKGLNIFFVLIFIVAILVGRIALDKDKGIMLIFVSAIVLIIASVLNFILNRRPYKK